MTINLTLFCLREQEREVKEMEEAVTEAIDGLNQEENRSEKRLREYLERERGGGEHEECDRYTASIQYSDRWRREREKEISIYRPFSVFGCGFVCNENWSVWVREQGGNWDGLLLLQADRLDRSLDWCYIFLFKIQKYAYLKF